MQSKGEREWEQRETQMACVGARELVMRRLLYAGTIVTKRNTKHGLSLANTN